MSSSGTISLKEIWAMLEVCLPNATVKAKKHRWWITNGMTTYRGLPLGEHGKRKDPEIEVGHVRHMVRFFEIVECAKKQLEQLRN